MGDTFDKKLSNMGPKQINSILFNEYGLKMKTAQTEGLDEVFTAIILSHSRGKRN